MEIENIPELQLYSEEHVNMCLKMKNVWHTDVDVLWLENACADTTCSVEWVNKTHKSAPKNIDEFVLFVDNLTAQQPDNEGNKWVDKEEDRSVDDDCMVFSQWMICRRN